MQTMQKPQLILFQSKNMQRIYFMKYRFLTIAAVAVAATLIFSGCSKNNVPEETAADTSVTSLATAPVVSVGSEGMTPVYGSDLKDGEYNISVDSSSTMFNITSCKLTVAEGEMTACMTMGGKGYLYLFMGVSDEAEGQDNYIPYAEDENGAHTFTVPVEALDKEISCAAFSKNKEAWYDRTLVFRADSLPVQAFKEGIILTAQELSLTDGEYTVEVTVEGGSGRASVQSPARLRVENGEAYAQMIWSSSNYDYMAVEGEKYYPTSLEPGSTFEIPVTGFDYKMPVSADTTAMSTPHEIEYTLYFDSSTISELNK